MKSKAEGPYLSEFKFTGWLKRFTLLNMPGAHGLIKRQREKIPVENAL